MICRVVVIGSIAIGFAVAQAREIRFHPAAAEFRHWNSAPGRFVANRFPVGQGHKDGDLLAEFDGCHGELSVVDGSMSGS